MQDSMLESDGGGRGGLVLEEAGGIRGFCVSVTKCGRMADRFEDVGHGFLAAGVLPPPPPGQENRSSVSE